MSWLYHKEACLGMTSGICGTLVFLTLLFSSSYILAPPIHKLLNESISFKNGTMKKVCFITTGATARFDALIVAALSPECLQAFSDNGFTHINFQCGASLPQIEVLIPEEKQGLVLSYFDFNKQGLNKEMRACQEDDGSRNPDDQRKRGLIICHAGMF